MYSSIASTRNARVKSAKEAMYRAQSPRAAVEPRDDQNQVEMLSTAKNSKSQVISAIASSGALTTKRPAWSRAWTEGVAPPQHPPNLRVGPIQRYETRTKSS